MKRIHYIYLLIGSLAFFAMVFILHQIFVRPPEKGVANASSNSKTVSSDSEWNEGSLTNITVSSPGDMTINNKVGSVSELPLTGATASATGLLGTVSSVIDANNCGTGVSWNDGDSGSASLTIDLGEEKTASPHVFSYYYGLDSISFETSLDQISWFSVALTGSSDHCSYGWDNELNYTSDTFRYFRVSITANAFSHFEMFGFSLFASTPATGVHTSSASQFDGGQYLKKWTTFAPTDTIPVNTAINYRFRTSTDASTWGSWTSLAASADSIDTETLLGATDAAKRYLQVESTLANTDNASTPTLDSYTANYEYAVLDHVQVTPASATLDVNDSQSFTAVAYDDSDEVIPGASFTWSASCGSVDSSGNYTAPASPVSCTVTAETTIDGSTKQGTASVTVNGDTPTPPSCSDGIQNQDETGVDCGGSCSACPAIPTCTDGIQNGDETGVDTGGSCEPEVPCQFGWNQLNGNWFCGDPVCATVDHMSVLPKNIDTLPSTQHLLSAILYRSDGSIISDGIVNWTITGGKIISNQNHSIVYETPSVIGTYTVTAKICEHSATATISVKEVISFPNTPLSINLTASPENASLYPGQTKQYSASVTNQDGSDVTSFCPISWAMQDTEAGSITSTGLLASTSNSGTWDSAIKVSTACYGLTSYQLLSFTTSCKANNSCGGGGGILETTNIWPLISENLTASLLAFAALLVALLILAISSLGNILPFLHPNQWFSIFMKGRERQFKSGIIYDTASGLGVPGAIINLFRVVDNKLINTAVSNRYGYFSLILPSGTECYVKVQKSGYIFQTFNQINQQSLKFSNNYFGEKILPSDKNSVFNKAIPMALVDPLNLYSKRVLAWERAEKILRLINLPLLIIGSIASIIVVSDNPSTYNLIILIFYALSLLQLFVKFFFTGKRTVGKIIKSDSKEPVELAIVRAVLSKNQRPTRTVVSNQKGEFTLTVPAGDYQVISVKSGLTQTDPINISVDKRWKGFQAVAKTLYMTKNPAEQNDRNLETSFYRNYGQEVPDTAAKIESQNSKSDSSRYFNSTDQLIERYRENIKNNPDLKDTGNFV